MNKPSEVEKVKARIEGGKVKVKGQGSGKKAEQTPATAKPETKPRQKSPEDEVFHKALVEAYVKKKEPLTSGDIATITGTKRGPVRRAMAKLIEQGTVEGIEPKDKKNIKLLYKPREA